MTASLSRRSLLRRLVGGVTLIAAGGLVWRAWDAGVFDVGKGAAYEPWHDWRNDRPTGPLAIAHAGLLAASAHNTQPWRFDVRDRWIALYADLSRHLGSFDPYRREMTLSVGCALENMALAAAAEGFEAEIEVTPGRLVTGTPEAARRPIALLLLEPGERRQTDCYRAIANRHTHRGAYLKDRSLDDALKAQLVELAAGIAGVDVVLVDREPARSRLAELTVAATREIIGDEEMAADSARWFRLNRDAVDGHRDGVTVDTFGLPPALNAAVKLLPTPSHEMTDRQWLDATRDIHLATAPLLGLITVNDLYDRPTALAAGRLWQRLHLWATTQGLAAQPLNQLPERVDREAQLGLKPRTAVALAALLGSETARPTFVFRMGYADRAARLSPRRPLGDVLMA